MQLLPFNTLIFKNVLIYSKEIGARSHALNFGSFFHSSFSIQK